MRINNTLTAALVTEKSTAHAAEGRYSFKVGVKATKGKIKEEIERVFGVTVLSVNTHIIPGKKRAVRGKGRQRPIRTAMFKKAVVQLKEGDKIELYD